MYSKLVLLLLIFPAVIYTQPCNDKLAKFVDELPIPAQIQSVWDPKVGNYPIYTVEMTQDTHKLHRDLPPTKMWLYNKQFPGPTFEVETYTKINIKFINNLPINKPLLNQSDLGMTNPQDRTVVHLHGSVSKPQYCGLPMDTVRPINGSNTYVNYHANQQDAGLLFYHDHAMQTTGANVYAGLVGIYILRDDHERSLNLPRGQYEIPLVICDRDVNLTSGQLIYDYNRGFLGADYQVINGKIWPYKSVEPGKYRFRVLNGANHRFYNISFSNNMSFKLIGVDQGFLKKAVTVTSVFLGPAERADIIVDFAGFNNKNITLVNTAPSFFPLGSVGDGPCTTGTLMQFRVGNKLQNSNMHGVVPTGQLYDYDNERPEIDSRVKHHNITLRISFTPSILFTLNGQKFLSRVDRYVPLGATEVWEFQNTILTAHPMHIHMVGFYVVERIQLNATRLQPGGDGVIQYVGAPIPAPPTEYGRKDVAVVFPFQALRIVMTFGPYPGEFVYHCHLLEHEDNDMMRRFVVGPVGPDCQWDGDEQDEGCDFDD